MAQEIILRARKTRPEEWEAGALYFIGEAPNMEIVLVDPEGNLVFSGGRSIREQHEYGAVISGGRPVYVASDGKAYPFDVANAECYYSYAGIAEKAGSTGYKGMIVSSGILKNVGANYLPGKQYFIGSNGLPSITPAAEVYKPVGVGVSANELLIINSLTIVTN